MALTSWHTPRTLKKKSVLSLADFSVASQESEHICRIYRLFIFELPSIRIVTEEVWRYVVLFQLTTREKDDGKYEIMMAVTMTQQEGPTACPEKPCQPSSIRPRSGRGVRH